MDKYVCQACGYIYDPEKGDEASGIAPGTAFEDLPDGLGLSNVRRSKEHVRET